MSRLEQYGVIIDGKHTYRDYGLISVSPVFIDSSSIKTDYTELPGADGALDYTDALTGEPAESSRSGSWKFVQFNQGFTDIQRKLNAINGKLCIITLDDNHEKSYHARLTVDDLSYDGIKTNVTIKYEVIDPAEVEGR